MAGRSGGQGVWAVVVAAGTGTRFGGRKQYAPLGGRRVLDWAVASVRDGAEGVVLVVPPDAADVAEVGVDVVVAGGATRSGSVRNGLAAVPASAEVVAVHDAARPFATGALLQAVVDAVRAGADAAVPGLPVADTLKRVDGGGRVVATVERGDVVAVQTPQGFRAAALRRAHERGGEATDDAGLVEAAGGTVVVVPGEADNRKLTTADDLAWAAWVAGRRGAS